MGDSQSLTELLQTLENACESINNPHSRYAAENILKAFRASPGLLPKCQYLLEHSQQPLLQFQVASAIQEAIVREYSEYQEADVSAFVHWLVEYCVHNISLQRYVRDAILRAAAIALKRLSLSQTYDVTPQILAILHMFSEGNPLPYAKLVYLSCLNEYLDTFIPSQTAKHTEFHLPLEQHIHSKAQLDSSILQPLWVSLTRTLETCISQPPADDSQLIQKSITCCETIISWDFGIEEGTFRRVSFGPTTAVKPGEDDEDEDIQPIWPGSWAPVVNEFVTGSNSLGSKHARQCLVYLAKLHGPALSSPQERQEHICSFFDNLEESLSSLPRVGRQIHEAGPHALHLATLTHTLIHELKITSGLGLVCQSPTLLTSIVLAWKFVLSTAPYEEGTWSWDAASQFAASWSILLDSLGKMEHDPLARGVMKDLKNEAAEMVDIYIRGRLAWAERQANKDEDEEMDAEVELKDWQLYEEELKNWAGVARPISSECLTSVLEHTSHSIDEFSRFDDLENSHVLYILDETIQWILLVTGFFFADEPPVIPYPRQRYTATSNLATAIAEQILKFFDSVGTESDAKWSPLVVETLYWWFERWGYAYLFGLDGEGSQLGVPGGGDWTSLAAWSIARMRKDVEGWAAEKEVITQIITTLKTFSRVGRVRHGLLVCENMPELVQYLIANISDLPEACHSDLVSAIVLLASGADNVEVRDFYMGLLVNPIQQRFQPVFRLTNLSNVEMDKICNGVEMLEGIFNASQPSTQQMIFQFVLKFLQPIASLIARVSVERTVAIAALRLFELITRKADFTDEWAKPEKKRLEVAIGELLANYRRLNDDTKDDMSEDEPFVDICYVADMLDNMIASDTLQFEPFTPWSWELFSLGLDIILLKMTPENFEIPQPSIHVSRLLLRMLEHQTAQILQLPQTRISQLISSLILCIRNPLKEVQESGFRAIASLALYIRMNSAPSFVQELLEMLLTETMASLFIGGVDTDSVSSACSAVHGLSTILPEKYQSLLHSVLQRCQGEKYERLGRALEKFTVSARKKFEGLGMEMDPEGNLRDLVSAREVEINEQEIWGSLEVIWGVLRVR